MNCISSPAIAARRGRRGTHGNRCGLPVGLILLLVFAPPDAGAQAGNGSDYSTDYGVRIDPATHSAEIELVVAQDSYLLREVRMQLVGERFTSFEGDGEIVVEPDEVIWHPPARGGQLRWLAAVEHRRNGDGYDAWIGPEWAIFRAEDVIPRAATRTLKGARAQTRLRFELPRGWSVVTEYQEQEGSFRVRHTGRRFDQPRGWIVTGRLGVRRERIAGVSVAVAAPVDNGVRRMDMLALLNWTLPEMARIVPDMPARLTIVSAGDPMWRGGLSAPQSLYIHADRPMISENGTSTLLHEVAHLALGIRARRGYDWIVEGLAEYFSLELLERSGTISESRHDRARSDQEEWSDSADRLCGGPSSGATTALAVTVFIALDKEMRAASKGKLGVDDVVAPLVERDAPVDLARLDRVVTDLLGHESETLRADNLEGCRKIAPTD